MRGDPLLPLISCLLPCLHPPPLPLISHLLSTHLLSSPSSPLTGAEDLLTKSGDHVHFSQLLPHDAGGNMKAPRGQKSTTVSVGDGPPRIVPVDKEDEYISGLLITLPPHRPIPPFIDILYPLGSSSSVLIFPLTILLFFSILYFTVLNCSLLFFFRYWIQHG
jgi:hypothetical protein